MSTERLQSTSLEPVRQPTVLLGIPMIYVSNNDPERASSPGAGQDRRSFLAAAGALTAAMTLATQTASADDSNDASAHPVCIFAKHLQLMSWPELAKFCREIEVDGIEATVRSGGQVEPAAVVDKLPQLCAAMSATDTRVVIITTDINSPHSPHAEAVLRTAALAGVTHYRMSYYRYNHDQPSLPQLDGFARAATELAAMNHDLGVTGLYQNHAGATNVGGPMWDLQTVLAGIDPADIGVAYDVRHATVEANQSWPIDLAMIRERIATVYVKDYRAVNGKIENVPLGEGDVSRSLFKDLKSRRPPGPISLHMEYVSHTDPKLVQACADAYRQDRQSLRNLLGV